MSKAIYIIWALVVANPFATASEKALKENHERVLFVDVQDLAPSVRVEARYFSSNNFLGRPVKGYKANKCLLTKEAAQAIVKAQNQLKPQGLGLKVFDCYRPQRAVDDFVSWSKDRADKKMKTFYYPDIPKSELFQRGYIASRSGHSRGSTVDLTLVSLKKSGKKSSEKPKGRCDQAGQHAAGELDMGTGYDCFSPLSHTLNPRISKVAQKHRKLLKNVMEQAGFTNYEKEWWHYTLKDEPFPQTYFDLEVQ